MLGVTFGMALLMEEEILDLVEKVSWKIRTLLRAKKFYSAEEIITEYKARIHPVLDYRTSALYHSSSTALAKLDRLQSNFLSEIGVSKTEALLIFILCPYARDVIWPCLALFIKSS